jgi:hypothetical protein
MVRATLSPHFLVFPKEVLIMGLNITLETEDGEIVEEIGDPTNLLHRLLPSHDDSSYQCVRFIDWYGDTVFNRLQMGTFLDEWEQIDSMAQTAEEKELVARVESLAQRCLNEHHLYLKFYGD